MKTLLLVLALLLPTSAMASTVTCVPASSVLWHDGFAVADAYDDVYDFGPTVFALDLLSGEYLDHLIGGRAGTTGGGTLTIIAPGDATGRIDFVGIDLDEGTLFRIILWKDGMPFVRTHRSGEVDVGTCRPGELSELLPSLNP